MSSPRSPKRRKILSSINPTNDGHDKDDHHSRAHRSRDHRRSRSRSPPPRRNTPDRDRPTTHIQEEATDTAPTTSHDNDAPRVTKFRFKSHSSHRRSHRSSHRSSRRRSRSRSRSRTRHRDDPSTTTRHRRRRHDDDDDPSRPRRHRRHRSPSPAPAPASASQQEQPPPSDPFSAPPLDRDAAFRESLFDAMADDEGAAYWESVYGQPIHVYGPGPSSTAAGGPLERMTEDEYAAHVRQKMWEKTHAGLIEERARREQARLAKDEELRAGEAERARIRVEMERSLRRGEERRRRRGWEGYLGRWKAWGGEVEGIPWPVVAVGVGEEGREEAVRAFFVEGLGLEEVGEREFAARLKEERVRWHPDKMQQRLGGTVDEGVMREVTATFQVIEGLWNDTRGK